MRNHFSFRKKKGSAPPKRIFFARIRAVSAADTAPLELKSAQSHSAPRGARYRGIRQKKRRLRGASSTTELLTCCSLDFGLAKVFVHLFQKVADSKGSAFGRAPQRAEPLILQKLRRGTGNPSKGFPGALFAEPFFFRRKRVPHLQKESSRRRKSPRRFPISG